LSWGDLGQPFKFFVNRQDLDFVNLIRRRQVAQRDAMSGGPSAALRGLLVAGVMDLPMALAATARKWTRPFQRSGSAGSGPIIFR